jgi:mRNA-degrading endonuclease RelE of RelBE toxin-antitoxin system
VLNYDVSVVGTPSFMKYYHGLRETDHIKKEIDEATTLMKNDDNIGVYIKEHLWPKIYKKNHDVTNLYKYDIDSCRLIYTIKGTPGRKHYQILDFLTHKEYNVLFRYKTR